jgi:hypothetical protein
LSCNLHGSGTSKRETISILYYFVNNNTRTRRFGTARPEQRNALSAKLNPVKYLHIEKNGSTSNYTGYLR